MARMHIHISVDDLDRSIDFYSTIFGTKPTTQKTDYAKWLLDNPSINFAISSRGFKPGIEHIGIQAENEDEMSDIRSRLEQGAIETFDDGQTVCCYAESDKSWIRDPSGIPWETYFTMKEAQFFSEHDTEPSGGSCCSPDSVEAKNDCSPNSGCC
jgi:catechol 2,3-dioxygenase-like lactoylglutathione lyase family enzyme